MPLMSIPRIKLFEGQTLSDDVAFTKTGKPSVLRGISSCLSYYAAVNISLIKSCYLYIMR